MSVQCEQMIATMPELGQLPGILTKSTHFIEGVMQHLKRVVRTDLLRPNPTLLRSAHRVPTNSNKYYMGLHDLHLLFLMK